MNNIPGVILDNNESRLSEYKDKTAFYAYLVGQANTLEHFIEMLKLQGWEEYGVMDIEHKNNITMYKDYLTVLKEQIKKVSKETKLTLKDIYNQEY